MDLGRELADGCSIFIFVEKSFASLCANGALANAQELVRLMNLGGIVEHLWKLAWRPA